MTMTAQQTYDAYSTLAWQEEKEIALWGDRKEQSTDDDYKRLCDEKIKEHTQTMHKYEEELMKIERGC